jgi:hypothetical protein
MRKSQVVLILHCLFFAILVACALVSPLLRFWKPELYEEVFFPTYAVVMIVTISMWFRCLGGCLLTRLENNYREKEGLAPYTDTFVLHYTRMLTGRNIQRRTVNGALWGVVLIPWIVWLL